MIEQSESGPDDAIAGKTESGSMAQVRRVVIFVRDTHSSITEYGISSEIVLPFNISHDPFHLICPTKSAMIPPNRL